MNSVSPAAKAIVHCRPRRACQSLALALGVIAIVLGCKGSPAARAREVLLPTCTEAAESECRTRHPYSSSVGPVAATDRAALEAYETCYVRESARCNGAKIAAMAPEGEQEGDLRQDPTWNHDCSQQGLMAAFELPFKKAGIPASDIVGDQVAHLTRRDVNDRPATAAVDQWLSRQCGSTDAGSCYWVGVGRREEQASAINVFCRKGIILSYSMLVMVQDDGVLALEVRQKLARMYGGVESTWTPVESGGVQEVYRSTVAGKAFADVFRSPNGSLLVSMNFLRPEYVRELESGF